MVHTLLSANSYEITSDSGIQLDQDSALVTRTIGVTFRGTLQQLYAKFQFGSQNDLPEAQTPARVFCAGPSNVSMIPGTLDNPHWDCTVEWVGLHSYTPGTGGLGSAVWKLTPNWTTREFKLPWTNSIGTDSSTVLPASYMVPAGANDAVSCTVYDAVPSIMCRGVISSAVFPHPRMAELTTLRAILPAVIPASQINENMADMSSPAATEVGYNWCKEMGATSFPGGTILPSVGAWRIGDISADRVIEPTLSSGAVFTVGATRIYVLSFPAIWTPRRSPL